MYPTQPPLNTRRVVLMFTVYKDKTQLSFKSIFTRWKTLMSPCVTAVLFFWRWTCCLPCVVCTGQSLPRWEIPFTSAAAKTTKRFDSLSDQNVEVNRGQGLMRTGVNLKGKNKHLSWIVSSLWDLAQDGKGGVSSFFSFLQSNFWRNG